MVAHAVVVADDAAVDEGGHGDGGEGLRGAEHVLDCVMVVGGSAMKDAKVDGCCTYCF